MSTTTRRPAVISAEAAPMKPIPRANASYKIHIDRANTGCQSLVQRVFRYGAGTSPEMKNEGSEEVIYIVSGSGKATIGGDAYKLTPGTGLFVPPEAPYTIHNAGLDPLELVSVLSPQPGYPPSVPPSSETQPIRKLVLRESEQESISADEDRSFKLMIDPRYGTQYVTQFVGFIRTSRAPFHSHPYEEVMYILNGEGVLHVENGEFPFRAGSGIYLPPESRHCLENVSSGTLRLLGVFCPADSPKARSSQDPE